MSHLAPRRSSRIQAEHDSSRGYRTRRVSRGCLSRFECVLVVVSDGIRSEIYRLWHFPNHRADYGSPYLPTFLTSHHESLPGVHLATAPPKLLFWERLGDESPVPLLAIYLRAVSLRVILPLPPPSTTSYLHVSGRLHSNNCDLQHATERDLSKHSTRPSPVLFTCICCEHVTHDPAIDQLRYAFSLLM